MVIENKNQACTEKLETLVRKKAVATTSASAGGFADAMLPIVVNRYQIFAALRNSSGCAKPFQGFLIGHTDRRPVVCAISR